jgi:thiol-disulfide isomerase/thioredoxin
MKKNIVVYSVIGLLFATSGLYFGMKQAATPALLNSPVDILFAQSLPDTKGATQALAQWKGKPLVVNFWATWCSPCIEEIPELSVLQREIAPQNIQIIGIGIDTTSNITDFSLKHPVAYPLYNAGMNGTTLLSQFGNQAGGLPFTLLIDKKGQIKKTYRGRLQMEELRKDLTSL